MHPVAARLLPYLTWPLGPGLDAPVRMLGYHSVEPEAHALSISPATFFSQIDWLVRRAYRFLTLNEWWAAAARRERTSARAVILTFDDGYRSMLEHVASGLAARGIRASAFLSADFVERANDHEAGRAPALPLLSWADVEVLQRQGWEFHSHGRTHRRLVELDDAALEVELAGSKAILQQRLGTPVSFFCYPHGMFDPRVMAAVARAGYLGAVTCRSGPLPAGQPQDAYQLPRIMVEQLTSLRAFAFCFTPAYRRLIEWRQRWRAQPGWARVAPWQIPAAASSLLDVPWS